MYRTLFALFTLVLALYLPLPAAHAFQSTDFNTYARQFNDAPDEAITDYLRTVNAYVAVENSREHSGVWTLTEDEKRLRELERQVEAASAVLRENPVTLTVRPAQIGQPYEASVFAACIWSRDYVIPGIACDEYLKTLAHPYFEAMRLYTSMEKRDLRDGISPPD